MVTVPSICKSFQVVSFALWIVCRREIGRLSAWWVSGCFIGWGKFASWKGPLMRSREAMLSRHSVTLITFGIGCRNTCLRKERTSTRNQLKTCWSPACQRNCSPTSPPVRLLPSLRRLNRRPPQKVRPREREKQWQQSKRPKQPASSTGCLPDASMERNASISMSLLSHLPEDQGGFIHPIVSKSHEVCAVPSLVG